METNRLAIFLDVCKTGNFSETGRNLYVSRSAIVQEIKKLENELGVQLFQRSTHAVKITKSGKVLQPLAENILKTENKMFIQLHNFSKVITIGTIYSKQPKILTEFFSKNKDLRTGYNIEFEELHGIKNINHHIDFIEYYEITKMLDQSFSFLPLREEPIYIAMPQDHPLVTKKRLKLTDLVGYDVAIEQTGISVIGDQVKEQLEQESGINLKSFGLYDSAFFAKAQFQGYLICLAEGMAQDVSPYVLRPLDISVRAQYGLYYRKNSSKIATHFLEKLQEIYVG